MSEDDLTESAEDNEGHSHDLNGGESDFDTEDAKDDTDGGDTEAKGEFVTDSLPELLRGRSIDGFWGSAFHAFGFVAVVN